MSSPARRSEAPQYVHGSQLSSSLKTAGLHPASTATVLRVKDSEVMMTDGPYLEGKEHLGGFTVITVPDLDVALEWGRRMARAIGLLPIEVRPLETRYGD